MSQHSSPDRQAKRSSSSAHLFQLNNSVASHLEKWLAGSADADVAPGHLHGATTNVHGLLDKSVGLRRNRICNDYVEDHHHQQKE